ncbi:hypothetical protein JCM10295v2_004061 [Rhodotorula toruloides]
MPNDLVAPCPGPPNPPAASYALWSKQESTHTSWQDVFLAMQLAGLHLGMVELGIKWSDDATGRLRVHRTALAGETNPPTTLCRAKPVNRKERDGPWRVCAWHKVTLRDYLRYCEDNDRRVSVTRYEPTVNPILLFRYMNLTGLDQRCAVEAALRIESRRRGRFLRSETSTVHCNDRDRTLLIYTCTTSPCSCRVQLESSLSPTEWCCTVLRPFHKCPSTGGEISPDLQKCLDYFPPVEFDLPLSPPPTPTLARHAHADSATAERVTSPSVRTPKEEDQPDRLVLDDSDQNNLDFDCIVAGDPFRSPTPENDYQMHGPFATIPRSHSAARKAKPAVPSRSSSAAANRQPSTTPKAPLENQVSALKAQLAVLEQRLEQRLEAKTQSKQTEKRTDKVQAARTKVRGLKGKLKAGKGSQPWYGRRGPRKRQQN